MDLEIFTLHNISSSKYNLHHISLTHLDVFVTLVDVKVVDIGSGTYEGGPKIKIWTEARNKLILTTQLHT